MYSSLFASVRSCNSIDPSCSLGASVRAVSQWCTITTTDINRQVAYPQKKLLKTSLHGAQMRAWQLANELSLQELNVGGVSLCMWRTEWWCSLLTCLVDSAETSNANQQETVLSQRWPSDRAMCPIHGCPENFRTPWLRPRLLFPTFFMGFFPIDPMNVPTKFEVRSFTRSWDNRGYPKNLGSSWIRTRSLLSKNFYGLLFGLAL